MIEKALVRFALSDFQGGAALAMMRLSLLDWAACAIAGRREPVARIVREMVSREGGQGAAMIGGGEAAPRGAALVNGTVSHALDYDDTHFAHIGHPSVAVIPAALAVAQTNDVRGGEFLKACLVGVEASIRVGVWLGRGHYQTGFHQTGTAGAFGATVATGQLLGLSEDQMRHALGVVATRASGLKSQFGTMGKPFNAGIAASNGVEAAMLAQAGFVSHPLALSGAQGFGPTHHGEADETALEGLGEVWQFETISHKFHACCHGLHAMLEALRDADVDSAAISQVQVATHPRWLSVCNNPEPKTGLEAKFSYRMTGAMALLGYDTAAMNAFHDGLSDDKDLVSLAKKVNVTGDETLSETEANVRITAGETCDVYHDLSKPMTLETRTGKLRTKSIALIGEAKANALWAATQTDDLDGLIALLSTST